MMFLGISWNGVYHVARFYQNGNEFFLNRDSLEHRIANIKQQGCTPTTEEYAALIELKQRENFASPVADASQTRP